MYILNSALSYWQLSSSSLAGLLNWSLYQHQDEMQNERSGSSSKRRDAATTRLQESHSGDEKEQARVQRRSCDVRSPRRQRMRRGPSDHSPRSTESVPKLLSLSRPPSLKYYGNDDDDEYASEEGQLSPGKKSTVMVLV